MPLLINDVNAGCLNDKGDLSPGNLLLTAAVWPLRMTQPSFFPSVLVLHVSQREV